MGSIDSDMPNTSWDGFCFQWKQHECATRGRYLVKNAELASSELGLPELRSTPLTCLTSLLCLHFFNQDSVSM